MQEILVEQIKLYGEPPPSGPVRLLVHDRFVVHRDEAFWCGRSVSQGAVWPDGVVVDPPFLDDDLGLFQGVEDLAVEEFIRSALARFLSSAGSTPCLIRPRSRVASPRAMSGVQGDP